MQRCWKVGDTNLCGFYPSSPVGNKRDFKDTIKINTDGSQLMMAWLTILQLYDDANMVSTQPKPYFRFWILISSQACYMQSDTFSWCWPLAALAPHQPHNHEGKQLVHLHPFCTHTTILFLTVNRYSLNYVSSAALYCKIGFMSVFWARVK